MNLHQLQYLFAHVVNRDISQLFANDGVTNQSRAQRFSLEASELFLDYSKQNITDEELHQLINWAKSSGLADKVTSMFAGERINVTENRAVLHSLLRADASKKKQVLGSQAEPIIEAEKNIEQLVTRVHSGQMLSSQGKPFTDVLVIGIGGSYYGIKLALSALATSENQCLNVHVLANVDSDALVEKLDNLNPETTLVVVISKTFNTQETMLNAAAVKEWMLSNKAYDQIIEKHWFAVTSNTELACQFGILQDHILPMWDWVGGRFSVWSAVGLPIALAFGNEVFSAFKNGARAMDEHFQTSDYRQNMPIIMALLGIWNRNVLQYPSLAILPYSHKLRALPGYLQQTDMESNGKAVNCHGQHVRWNTAPIVFGQEGTNSQHAFMQLMHQAKDIIPTDFIVPLTVDNSYQQHHMTLVANCFAQSEALMRGKSLEQVTKELIDCGMSMEDAAELAPHKAMKGNTPSNTLLLNRLEPHSFGALLALYEHKIAVQGFLWEVNSFDQWGVELGKQLGQQIINSLKGEATLELSSSTSLLSDKYRAANHQQ